MSNLYWINVPHSKFRSISIVENDNHWGAAVIRWRGQAIDSEFGPIEVEWTPESRGWAIADFVRFRGNILAINKKAKAVCAPFLEPNGSWLEFVGLDYVGFYCTEIHDCLDECATNERLAAVKNSSIHSIFFCPTLRSEMIPNCDVFQIPQTKSKIFVRECFKKAYEDALLTGLDFTEVPLT